VRSRESGAALLVALLAVLLMSAIASALLLTTTAEAYIAANFRDHSEAVYAANAIVERAIADLLALPDWAGLVDGSARSAFNDGPPGGTRVVAGRAVDVSQVVNQANCQKPAACTTAELDAVTASRPWGVNNPRWQPYAYGFLRDLLPAGRVDSPFFTVLLVGDDAAETDNDPVHDGRSVSNPGSGIVVLRGEAFGPRGAHSIVEAVVLNVRTVPAPEPPVTDPDRPADAMEDVDRSPLKVLAWREVR
jgi:hypothetical protein